MVSSTPSALPAGRAPVAASMAACTTRPNASRCRAETAPDRGSRRWARIPRIAETAITVTPIRMPSPPWAMRSGMVMAQVTSPVSGPKNSAPQLSTTDLPSKTSPSQSVNGRSMPIMVAVPNTKPCSNCPARVRRSHRSSTNPLITLRATSSERL